MVPGSKSTSIHFFTEAVSMIYGKRHVPGTWYLVPGSGTVVVLYYIIANHSSQWVAYESFICVLLINI